MVLHLHLDYNDEEIRWALRTRPDLVILCAEFMRPSVERVLVQAMSLGTAVVTIRNAVDTGSFRVGNRAEDKRKLGLEPAQPLILMAANVARHKGQETAIRAVHHMWRSGPHRPMLLLAGEERGESKSHTQFLGNLVDQLAIRSAVRFLGIRSDMPDLLRAADFLLLPSTQEGLPLVILEAQASGTVVLAAPTAGIPEVVEDGKTGFLVAAGDVRGYAERLSMLIEQPELGEAIAKTGALQVERRHNYSEYFDQLFRAYDDLMSGRLLQDRPRTDHLLP